MAKIARLIPETEIDPGVGSGDYTVKVIDYDGTVLLEKKGNTGDVIDLPTVPTHEKLVFQEWSASVAVSDNKVTITDNDIMVGAVYTTASGQNEFDITLTNTTGLSVILNMVGTKDWGDGTSGSETSHTYTAYGDYTIKCDGTAFVWNMPQVFEQSRSSRNCYCTAIRFATVANIKDEAFRYCDSLTNVVIPNNVTSIGNYAFGSCYSLTSIVIPNSVTSISDYTFDTCYSLKNVVIPNSVTSIGSDAFQVCYSLTNVVIPNSVTSIDDHAFYSCSSLTNVIIPNGVTLIRASAFYNCYSLTNVVIPNSATNIGGRMFESCYSLKSLVIPNGVMSIGDRMFYNCYSLKNVVIPNSATSIGSDAFYFCHSLKNVVVPNGVTSIGSDAFNSCYALTNVVIPNSVTSIGTYAFYYCYALTKYDFSQHTSVPTLSNTNAFSGINKIAKIIVPDSLYDEWIAAANWSTYADYIYKASEVTA